MKSHFFAGLGVESAILNPGFRLLCVREIQKSLKESAKRLIEDKILEHGLGGEFRVLDDKIITPGNGVIIFQGMQDHTAESVKSFEGFDGAWIEEAQTLSAKSLELLRPTIRKPGSEIWASWNPRLATDPVDKFFRGGNPPEGAAIVRVSWRDNPWFPEELERERQHDQKHNPHRYAHIWEGEYEPMAVGAIWDRDSINGQRRDKQPEIGRVLVAVDHAVSHETGANENGIIVAGIGREDKRGYVLADMSLVGPPHVWARRAVAAYDYYEADAVVVEVNQGGDLVKETLNTIRPGIPIIEVRATRGKHVRAEPIASLYALGRVSHVGTFPELENQMCQMTADGYQGEGSPDRVDALVWALTELFPDLTRKASRPIVQPPVSRGAGSWMGA